MLEINIKDVFILRWNKMDRKFWRKNGKENFYFVGVWLEGDVKKLVGSRCFLPDPIKMFSFQNGGKIDLEEFNR